MFWDKLHARIRVMAAAFRSIFRRGELAAHALRVEAPDNWGALRPSPLPNVFDGSLGRNRAEEVLRHSASLRDCPQLARELVRAGTIEPIVEGQWLCRQGDLSDDAFYILAGELAIHIKDKNVVACRKVGDLVGEMASLEPSPRRSASLLALKPGCVLRVPGAQFRRLVDRQPMGWKGIARELAVRLRERERFVPQTNERPLVFFRTAASRRAVHATLMAMFPNEVDRHPWAAPEYLDHSYVIDDLTHEIGRCDFAVFSLDAPTPFDGCQGGGLASYGDLGVEIGIALGILGRTRVFLTIPPGTSLPPRLAGVLVCQVDHAKGQEDLHHAQAVFMVTIRDRKCRSLQDPSKTKS